MIPEKLKELRESLSMNKKEFANYLNVKYTTYNGYETGSREPASDFLIMISQKMDVSIDYILGLTDEKEILHAYNLKSSEYEHIQKYRATDQRGQAAVDYILNLEYDRTQEAIKEASKSYNDTIIPIFNAVTLSHRSGAAGAGIGESADNIDVVQLDYPADKVPAGTDYTINVTGDSMLPTFADGDVLFCQHTQELNYGDIGIFILNGETYVKEYGKEGLISHNPDKERYGIITISDGDSLVVEGKVLGKL